MITDFDVDWDGFNMEIEEQKEELAGMNLPYADLLQFAARMIAERDYAEGLYKMACVDVEWLKKQWLHSLPIDVVKEMKHDAILHGMKSQKTATGKYAVSHREDQILKSNWQEHVKNCVAKGITINNVNDLLDAPGYDVSASNIQSVTLKKWAKEAAPSIKFKPGAPKK